MKILKKIKKIIYNMWRDSLSSDEYIKFLCKKGVRIGKGTSFINPKTTLIDVTRPWMIEIGESCCISGGTTILTHDYGWSVTKAVYGDVIGSVGKVKIGNNVYIGMHTTVLKGVTIGDNVIVGANSLITKDIPDNVVVAGNPARVIKTIGEYHTKRKACEVVEAISMVNEYKKVYCSAPPIEIMREHFWIFENTKKDINKEFIKVNNLVWGTEEKTWKMYLEHDKKFEDYEEFLEYCSNNR